MKLVLVTFLAVAAVGTYAQTCAGRCDTTGTDTSAACQCNKPCVGFGDCCSDYESACLSCDGRCNIGYNKDFPCQCNDQCASFGNCCSDFESLCDGGSSSGAATDTELRAISSDLFVLDRNNSGSISVINLQGSTSQGSYTDKAPAPLFTSVSDELLNSGTYALIRAMYDNYIDEVSVAEDVTAAERAEENAFIDAVLNSEVGQAAWRFLVQKGYMPEDFATYRAYFDLIWFGLYTRGGGPLGSSGFEHSFMGEMKSGISGLHNWVRYWDQEKAGLMNYLGYIKTADLDGDTLIEMPMQWQGVNKAISSILVGVSPELELSLFTICFIVRPGALCPVAANGANFRIQTYTLVQNGNTYVGSAYPTF